MTAKDFLALIHPILAVAFVFPLVGVALNLAWQTRQRRLHPQAKGKKIPPVVGREHLQYGKWLSGGVVGVTLIALAYSIFIKSSLFEQPPLQIGFVIALFLFTVAALVLLYRAGANQPVWRAVFATLTSAGLIVLGAQEGVFRRTNEWYVSHYYYGIAVAILMVVSLTVIPEIYKHKGWRLAHVVLNCLAVLLFLGQASTGTRDLLEIPLSWQQPYLYQCDWQNQTCPQANPQ